MAAAELGLVVGRVAVKSGRMLGRQARIASLAATELVANVLNRPADDLQCFTLQHLTNACTRGVDHEEGYSPISGAAVVMDPVRCFAATSMMPSFMSSSCLSGEASDWSHNS